MRETLDSILAQTYTNLIVHVLDNASSDDTVEIVKSFVDHRIVVHQFSDNVGGEGNFDRCIQVAEGKYTAVFHADDVYKPNMVEKQVLFLEENSNVGAVFTGAVSINEKGVAMGEIGRVPGSQGGGIAHFDFKGLLKTMLRYHNFLICPSVMVRTDIYKNDIKEWGNSLFRSSSDVDVWLRLARKQLIAVLEEPLMNYRISSAQFSEGIRKRTERTDFFLVMDHYINRPDVKSLLTKEDLRHYGWLQRHENASLALNFFEQGKNVEARRLLAGMFSWDALYAAAVSRRGFVTLLGAVLLQFLLTLGTNKYTVSFLQKIKKVSWK